MKIIEFIRILSRRMHLWFRRKHVYLLEDEKFQNFIKTKLTDKSGIKCSVCGKTISIDEILGCAIENNQLIIFCNDLDCIEKLKKE